MNLLNIAKGLFIGGVFFVGIFYFLNVQANRASAQAQAERAQVEAEQARAVALAEQAHSQKSQPPGRFQIETWNTNSSHGAYIIENETGFVYAVDGHNRPTLIGQIK